jgi:hypothetical protein
VFRVQPQQAALENPVRTLWTTSASVERNSLKITEKPTVLLKCAKKRKTEGDVENIKSFSHFFVQ